MKLTPSEALKGIGLLKENGCYVKSTVEYKIVETELQKTVVLSNQLEHERKIRIRQEKKLKVLEIIKEKRVNVSLFLEYNVDTYKDYIATFKKVNLGKELLTQEDFDLLKEALK